MKRFVVSAFALSALVLFVAACGGDGEEDTRGVPPSGDSTPADESAPSADAAPALTFAEACQKSDEKQFSEAPPRIIDTGKTYVATISTEKGDIVVELFSDVPITTNNFVFLACKGFYDGLTFHRVEPDFVIQGGDPTGTGGGGPGYNIPDEDDGDHLMEKGIISMARSSLPDSAGSQFFITIGLGSGGSLDYLDADFAVFGEVIEGMDVAEQIAVGDVIQTITIEER